MIKAIIFDFDDTLVYTHSVFRRATEDFCTQMRALGLYDQNLLKVQDEFDRANVCRAGYFAKNCFAESLAQTYCHYAKQFGQSFNNELRQKFFALGMAVYKQPIELLPDCEQVLKALKARYRLFLLTQGETEIQQARLERSGLLPYFEKYYILKRKLPADFIAVCDENCLPVNECVSVGNSLRSDINPALAAGLQAIYLSVFSWDFEYEQGRGEYKTVADLQEVRACLEV